eukprot:TRINITY_DN3273_c0_g7_i1.p2 TRINITY_DN3273_c0_g7~~TRINITY_DN3273_c0_g7_i1.p2  ORF type:complete len:197 (-),score=29.72 TRINITY_DN3273_c0_g7_i1:691-1281(-)
METTEESRVADAIRELVPKHLAVEEMQIAIKNLKDKDEVENGLFFINDDEQFVEWAKSIAIKTVSSPLLFNKVHFHHKPETTVTTDQFQNREKELSIILQTFEQNLKTKDDENSQPLTTLVFSQSLGCGKSTLARFCISLLKKRNLLLHSNHRKEIESLETIYVDCRNGISPLEEKEGMKELPLRVRVTCQILSSL